jgi:hypothetical protein
MIAIDRVGAVWLWGAERISQSKARLKTRNGTEELETTFQPDVTPVWVRLHVPR